MKLWEYIKGEMLNHGESTAFHGLSYSDLIKIIDNDVAMDCNAKQQKALDIFRVLKNGQAVCLGINEEIVPMNSEELAFVMPSSGTTGKPKQIALTHENIIENIKGIGEYFNADNSQKILLFRPFSHIAVIVGELLFGLCKGLELDFYAENFQPKRLARYVEENKVNVLCCTPTHFYHISKFLNGNNLKAVHLSGEILSTEIVKIIKDKFSNVDFYNGYGLTENSSRVSALTPTEFYSKVGSVGKPIRNTLVRLDDGELLVKSKSIMQGYLNNEELTDLKIRNGWLYTGDMARIDSDGYIYILGRRDDMIIRSGLNIYPIEIENVVKTINGVNEAVVYKEKDIEYGQKVCLKYVGDISVVELRKQLAGRLNAHYMPSVITKVDKLDMTASGKVQRK